MFAQSSIHGRIFSWSSVRKHISLHASYVFSLVNLSFCMCSLCLSHPSSHHVYLCAHVCSRSWPDEIKAIILQPCKLLLSYTYIEAIISLTIHIVLYKDNNFLGSSFCGGSRLWRTKKSFLARFPGHQFLSCPFDLGWYHWWSIGACGKC